MLEQSKELTEFYLAYRTWLKMGAPESRYLTKGKGLCGNLIRYYEARKTLRTSVVDIYHEMQKQFLAVNLCPNYPFNKIDRRTGASDYWMESTYDRCHLNPDRIKWVEEHCA